MHAEDVNEADGLSGTALTKTGSIGRTSSSVRGSLSKGLFLCFVKTHLLLLSLILAPTLTWAQQTSGECTFQIDCGPPWITHCGSTTNWSTPVDMDGNGTTDFLHLSVVRERICMMNDDPNLPMNGQRDTIEALFPQAGAEMYLITHGDIPPLLKAAEPVEPDGSPPFLFGFNWVRWEWGLPWAPTVLRHSGLGICEHYTGSSPCEEYPQLPSCGSTTPTGWLRVQNPAIFGFRIRKPDGWHLGWFKLEELAKPVVGPTGYLTKVKLVDYAVHPDPDTEIRAGEQARPTLKALISGGGTLLSWSTNWPGWTLSWSPTLNPVAWAPVEGVTTNTNRVTLATTNASGFFRLQEAP